MDGSTSDSDQEPGGPLEPAASTPTAPPAPVRVARRPRARFFRWCVRLFTLMLMVQLGLWLFIGRRTLVHEAPGMIFSDVHSVAALDTSGDLPSRTYIISVGLAEAIGLARLYELDRSLSDFNASLETSDDSNFAERAATDGCDDCLFVGLRQRINTPFLAKSTTSYTRPLVFSEMHGLQTRTWEREHVYVWVLGRWLHVRERWHQT